MPLQFGTTLGPYEILSPIGAGGMGEVYKARDTHLDRTVAIKVLPEHVAADPDLKQRFEREAKTISSLNHPHICTLYDIGNQDGIDFLVMEYLDGRHARPAAREGCAAAGPDAEVSPSRSQMRWTRRTGRAVTHRDLKPGNIMLTKAGAKLLDFGLAKLRDPKAAVISPSERETRRASLTGEGTILGTLQYMAPEQLEGKDADARTDIFAFGSIVYEMITGKEAFTGESQASLIAAILDSQPTPMSTLQPMSPPALDRVVRKCLGKDPEDRWQDVRDATDELKWIAEGGSQAGVAVPAGVPARGQSRLAWSVATVTTVLLAVALAVAYLNRAPAETATSRFSVLAEAGVVRSLALSPNGRQLAFTDGRQLWIRSLDSLESRALPGTEDAQAPFWSPDGRSIGFFTDH